MADRLAVVLRALTDELARAPHPGVVVLKAQELDPDGPDAYAVTGHPDMLTRYSANLMLIARPEYVADIRSLFREWDWHVLDWHEWPGDYAFATDATADLAGTLIGEHEPLVAMGAATIAGADQAWQQTERDSVRLVTWIIAMAVLVFVAWLVLGVL